MDSTTTFQPFNEFDPFSHNSISERITRVPTVDDDNPEMMTLIRFLGIKPEKSDFVFDVVVGQLGSEEFGWEGLLGLVTANRFDRNGVRSLAKLIHRELSETMKQSSIIVLVSGKIEDRSSITAIASSGVFQDSSAMRQEFLSLAKP